MRLSDLHLRVKAKAPKTWLDDYEFNVDKIMAKEDSFAQVEKKIREAAIARGRAQVPILVQKSMKKDFAKLRYDPYDIMPLLHPIEFVIFNGMNTNEMKDVVLFSRKTSNQYLNKFHNGISNAVRKKEYDWRVIRVFDDGRVKYE